MLKRYFSRRKFFFSRDFAKEISIQTNMRDDDDRRLELILFF